MPAPLESVYLEGSNPLQPVDAAPHRAGHNHVTHVLLRFILRELQQLQAYTCALLRRGTYADSTETCIHTTPTLLDLDLGSKEAQFGSRQAM